MRTPVRVTAYTSDSIAPRCLPTSTRTPSFSLLDGLSSHPGPRRAREELGMNAVAITDHGNMYGAIEFYDEAPRTASSRSSASRRTSRRAAATAAAPPTARSSTSRCSPPTPPATATCSSSRRFAPRGVLLQAADGPRAAGGPQRGADRAVRCPSGEVMGALVEGRVQDARRTARLVP